jgi:hypothetical protein
MPPLINFIEGWYNSQRRYSVLDDDSPVVFEQKVCGRAGRR